MGLFGKKKEKKQAAPQPQAELTFDTFVNDKNYDRVCQLVGYHPLSKVAEVGYFFITDNFCCAVDSEGIIYGEIDLRTNQPYAARFAMRPNEIGSVEPETRYINDGGVDLVGIRLVYKDSTRYYTIWIPCNDVEKFSEVVENVVADDAILRDMMGDDFGYGSFGPMPQPVQPKAKQVNRTAGGGYCDAPAQQMEETVMNPIKNADLERADWVARQNGYMNANDWAARNGQGNASDAYDNGYFNGKL